MTSTFELSEFFERGQFLLLNSLHMRREISISLLHLAMVIIAAGHFWQDSGSHQSKYWLISQSFTTLWVQSKNSAYNMLMRRPRLTFIQQFFYFSFASFFLLFIFSLSSPPPPARGNLSLRFLPAHDPYNHLCSNPFKTINQWL